MSEQGSAGRPDLEEFLSALSGFVDPRGTSLESSYLKFLDIFCRSVGSTEGQFLRPDDRGILKSIGSFGLQPRFQEDFNAVSSTGPSPLEHAYSSQKVVAIVDIDKSNTSPWLSRLLDQYGYKSLVAVPIVGPSGSLGVLCAYYSDVCLFDQNTLERLLSIGKMLGGAGTSRKQADSNAHNKLKKVDNESFVNFFVSNPYSKAQVFEHLCVAIAALLPDAPVLCGSVVKTDKGLALSAVSAERLPESVISRRHLFPLLLATELARRREPIILVESEQGGFAPLIKLKEACVLCVPMMFQGKVHGAALTWREPGRPFSFDDCEGLMRLGSIAALAFHAA